MGMTDDVVDQRKRQWYRLPGRNSYNQKWGKRIFRTKSVRDGKGYGKHRLDEVIYGDVDQRFGPKEGGKKRKLAPGGEIYRKWRIMDQERDAKKAAEAAEAAEAAKAAKAAK